MNASRQKPETHWKAVDAAVARRGGRRRAEADQKRAKFPRWRFRVVEVTK